MDKLRGIENTKQLRKRIDKLSEYSKNQEDKLKSDIKVFYNQIKPAQLLKNMLKDFRKDEEIDFDMKNFGTDVGFRFIANQFFGKNTIGGFLKANFAALIMKSVYSQFGGSIDSIISNVGLKIGDFIKDVFGKKDDTSVDKETEKFQNKSDVEK